MVNSIVVGGCLKNATVINKKIIIAIIFISLICIELNNNINMEMIIDNESMFIYILTMFIFTFFVLPMHLVLLTVSQSKLGEQKRLPSQRYWLQNNPTFVEY